MQIPKDIIEIHSKFKAAGKELFLVGGCVRDFKLGLDPKDFDMATNAFPEEIEQILEGHDFDLTGKQFGVMRVYTESEPIGYEIATYREDLSVGRKPIVKVGSTIENDSMRRDFTINALYYNIDTKEIIDLVGGLKDLDNRIVRACGNAKDRIKEDALRMLRAVRFKNYISGELDPELREAILEHPALEGPDSEGKIIPIAQERIAEEFLKGIKKSNITDSVDTYAKDLIEYQFIGQVFRNLHINENFMYYQSKPEILMADLLRFNTNHRDLLNKLVQQCKFSTDIAEGVVFLLDVENIDEDNAYSLKKRMNAKTLIKANDLLSYGNLMMGYGQYSGRIAFLLAFTKYEIKTNGDDLKNNEGFVEGAELGAEIAKRERDNFLNTYNTK